MENSLLQTKQEKDFSRNDFGCESLVYLELGRLSERLDSCASKSTDVWEVLAGERGKIFYSLNMAKKEWTK